MIFFNTLVFYLNIWIKHLIFFRMFVYFFISSPLTDYRGTWFRSRIRSSTVRCKREMTRQWSAICLNCVIYATQKCYFVESMGVTESFRVMRAYWYFHSFYKCIITHFPNEITFPIAFENSTILLLQAW